MCERHRLMWLRAARQDHTNFQSHSPAFQLQYSQCPTREQTLDSPRFRLLVIYKNASSTSTRQERKIRGQREANISEKSAVVFYFSMSRLDLDILDSANG